MTDEMPRERSRCMSRALRPIRAMSFSDLAPGGDTAMRVRFETVEPTRLAVDETYQRSLSERSVRLIRRIVRQWDWRGFKPPVVVLTEAGDWEVVDGQHTAIAAASHPGIGQIPVMIVDGASTAERAAAFVRHNRDRIAVTGLQLHTALLAAGDEEALTIAQVCGRAGLRLLVAPPFQGRYEAGDTMAIGSIRSPVRRRHAKGAREVLEVCARARMAPATAAAIKAVDTILFSPEYAGQVAREELAVTILKLGPDAERQANLVAAEHKVPIWRGLVAVLFRATPKVRRGQRAA